MPRNRLLVWALALGTLSAGCASSAGHVPRPFPTPVGSPSVGGPAGQQSLVATALKLRGTPYRNGGADPGGFDCSGFTQYVFAQFNVSLPRETRDQFRLGESIRMRDVAPGDLLFFTTGAPGASHVGIAISGD